MALLADCDLQMEAEFLTLEGAARGIDLHIRASFPDDVRAVCEYKHDVILVGALRSRGAIAAGPATDPDADSSRVYLDEARRLLEALRARNIPVLGIAFVGQANDDSEHTICRIGKVRRLGRLDNVTPLDSEHLRDAFEAGFSIGDFG